MIQENSPSSEPDRIRAWTLGFQKWNFVDPKASLTTFIIASDIVEFTALKNMKITDLINNAYQIQVLVYLFLLIFLIQTNEEVKCKSSIKTFLANHKNVSCHLRVIDWSAVALHGFKYANYWFRFSWNDILCISLRLTFTCIFVYL